MAIKCDDPENLQHAALAVQELLVAIGEAGDREGLAETPQRAAKAWFEWTAGYRKNPEDILKSFDGGDYNEMVVVRDIPVYSTCEHHLAAIFGTATIAYVPNGRVVGLSKLARLVDIFARRLQVQERMTVQIADALHGSDLRPLGVGVMLRCRHLCMEARGIRAPGTHTITTALRGRLREGEPRAEFLAVANSPV